jgi:hypothetical protein
MQMNSLYIYGEHDVKIDRECSKTGKERLYNMSIFAILHYISAACLLFLYNTARLPDAIKRKWPAAAIHQT